MKLEKGQMAINDEGLVLQYLGNRQLRCVKVGNHRTDWKTGEVSIDYLTDDMAREFDDSFWKKIL